MNARKTATVPETKDASITNALIIVITSLASRDIQQKKRPTAVAVFLCVPIIVLSALPRENVLNATADIP